MRLLPRGFLSGKKEGSPTIFVEFALKIKLSGEFDESLAPETYPADEAVRMPLAVERRYIVLHDSAITAAALRGEHVKVVLAAVRFTVPLVKALLAELFAALGAEEVLGMPGLLQGSHAFLETKHEFVRSCDKMLRWNVCSKRNMGKRVQGSTFTAYARCTGLFLA